jgi:hypothetical protein
LYSTKHLLKISEICTGLNDSTFLPENGPVSQLDHAQEELFTGVFGWWNNSTVWVSSWE